ncbi:MAG: phytanoyl-CoA dioxygenase family protein [Candidatus Latescibacterota bacterium]|nr:phytanoyl-CoA dioxygenase family protein [Candidatus Latescibacterota bacterium]
MARVVIPRRLRELAGGEREVEVEAATVRQVIEGLEAAYPGMKEKLYDFEADQLKRGTAVIVDGETSQMGLLKKISAESEVHFLPAMGGGADPIFSDAQAAYFDEHGYVHLGRVATCTQLTALRQRIDDLMLGVIEVDGVTFQLDGGTGEYHGLSSHTDGPPRSTLSYRRVDELHNDPVFLTYMQQRLFRDITRCYVGEDVSIFRSMFMNKPANQGTVLPWHQDVGAGWGIDTNPIATVWTALDDATVDTGCMQIVPGSHRLGILNPGHYTSEEDQAAYCSEDKVIDLEVAEGEAVLIHNWMLHRSGVNHTDRPRRAFSVAYMDAATREVKSGKRFPVIFGERALQPKLSAGV